MLQSSTNRRTALGEICYILKVNEWRWNNLENAEVETPSLATTMDLVQVHCIGGVEELLIIHLVDVHLPMVKARFLFLGQTRRLDFGATDSG